MKNLATGERVAALATLAALLAFPGVSYSAKPTQRPTRTKGVVLQCKIQSRGPRARKAGNPICSIMVKPALKEDEFVMTTGGFGLEFKPCQQPQSTLSANNLMREMVKAIRREIAGGSRTRWFFVANALARRTPSGKSRTGNARTSSRLRVHGRFSAGESSLTWRGAGPVNVDEFDERLSQLRNLQGPILDVQFEKAN
jgi:hypothetical protein